MKIPDRDIQAEDEIAGVCSAMAHLCRPPGGLIDIRPRTFTESEGLGLAVITELPLVVVDVREVVLNGPAQKTEQADLLQALWKAWRSPCVIGCFNTCKPF
jgi:2-oxoglutarate ferredoxin oxidoreductase subunit alpha